MKEYISIETIQNLKGEQVFGDKLKVKKVGAYTFQVIGYNYGEPEVKMTGFAEEVAHFLNGYFGN